MTRRLRTTTPALALAALLLVAACDGSEEPAAEPEPGPAEETTAEPEPTTEPVETQDPADSKSSDPEETESEDPQADQPDVGDGSYDAVDDACELLTTAGERADFITTEGEPSSADNSTMSERQCRFYAEVDGEEVSGTFTLVTSSDPSAVTRHHESTMEGNTSGTDEYPLTVDSPDVGDGFYVAYQEEADASGRQKINWGVQHGNLAATVTSVVNSADAMTAYRDLVPDLAESVLAESSAA